jgi:hypothetical protein
VTHTGRMKDVGPDARAGVRLLDRQEAQQLGYLVRTSSSLLGRRGWSADRAGAR